MKATARPEGYSSAWARPPSQRNANANQHLYAPGRVLVRELDWRAPLPAPPRSCAAQAAGAEQGAGRHSWTAADLEELGQARCPTCDPFLEPCQHPVITLPIPCQDRPCQDSVRIVSPGCLPCTCFALHRHSAESKVA